MKPVKLIHLDEVAEKVIQSLSKGPIEEMEWNWEKAHSCGAGGGMEFTNPGIAREAANRRYEQAARTGAEILVTASPKCAHQLSLAASTQTKVQDLVEMFAEAMEGE